MIAVLDAPDLAALTRNAEQRSTVRESSKRMQNFLLRREATIRQELQNPAGWVAPLLVPQKNDVPLEGLGALPP